MIALRKKLRSRVTGSVYEVVATDTGDNTVTVLHTRMPVSFRLRESLLAKLFEEVA